MSDRFESDVMEDLFYDAAEGPSQMEYGEEFEEGDAFEEGFEEFEEGFEEGFEGMEDAYEEMDALESMDDAVADALEEEDTDEFFRRLRRIARGVARVARRAAPVVGRLARQVAPIASAIPLPQAQAIGRVAGVLGRVLPNQADEFEALDEVLDLAEDEDAVDAAAPVIAGLAVRSAIPGVSRLPRPARRQLVRTVSQATRAVARRQGPQAARAIPAVVQGVQRTARRRGLPARALPQAVRRTVARVARSPQVVQRLARSATPPAARGRRGRGGRAYTLRGPVRIVIQGR
jgi:hypothetical protein